MSDLLVVRDVDAFYGRSHVLHGAFLTVSAGEGVLLLGRNGAGKSTMLRTIMGLVTVRAGSITFRDKEILGLPPHVIAHQGVGLVPEDRRVFAKLTVRENLVLGGKPSANSERADWDLEGVFALFPQLRLLQDRKSGTLSGGEQQMLTIARTLMGNPTLLLLDEPAEGLAPVIVDALADQLGTLRAQGLSMLISEQNLTFARFLADRAYVMETGAVRHHGTLTELDSNPAEWTKYLVF